MRSRRPREQIRPSREELKVIRSVDWKVHGNATWGTGMWGIVTECEVRGVTFYVRENIRGNHFMISGGERLGMKQGRVPKSFDSVLDVAAPPEALPWVMELVTRIDAGDAKASETRAAPARRAVRHAAFTMKTAPDYFTGRRGRCR